MDVTPSSGIDVTVGIKFLQPFDFDGDGDIDILVKEAVEGTPLLVYLNDGEGCFRREPLTAGFSYLASVPLAELDFDGDGITDILLVDESGRLHLLAGEGNLNRDASRSAGLSHLTSVVDFTITQMNGAQNLITLEKNGLLKRFELCDAKFAQKEEFVAPGANGFSVVDLDSDGDLDLLAYGQEGLTLFEKRGSSLHKSAISTDSSIAFAFVKPIDFNLDGLIDLICLDTLFSMHLLMHLPDGEFSDVTETCNLKGIHDVFAIDAADLNEDGFTDIIVLSDEGPRILENIGDGGNYLNIQLEGAPASAVGTSITLFCENWAFKTCIDPVKPLVVGAPSPIIDSVKVLWPDGKITIFRDVEANTRLHVQEENDNMLLNFWTKEDSTLQIYPNPTNGHFTLYFYIEEPSNVLIQLLSLSGQTIKTLLDEEKEPGQYSLFFPGEDLLPGTYLVRMVAGNKITQKKLIVLR